MPRFWVYLDSKVQGPLEVPALRNASGFNLLTQVCQEGEQSWRMADEVIEIKSYFLAPPRPNSFVVDSGNAAPVLTEPVAQPVVQEKPHVLSILEPAAVDAEPAPDPMSRSTGTVSARTQASTAPLPKLTSVVTPEPVAPGPNALRAVCAVCGYKNPRDVTACMKCGSPVAAPKGSDPLLSLGLTPSSHVSAAAEKRSDPTATATVAQTPSRADVKAGSTVEIPVTKALILFAIAGVLAGAGFISYRLWKRHSVKAVPVTPAPTPAVHRAPAPAARKNVRQVVRRPRSHEQRYGDGVRTDAGVRRPRSHEQRYGDGVRTDAGVRRPRIPAEAARRAPTSVAVPTLPGMSKRESPSKPERHSETAPYRVISEAQPLQRRTPAPVNSAYAAKRRGDQSLWVEQEDHAVRQVQRWRIYGGQRTVQRNTEILMQILRDREYNAAFESGKRLSFYNDIDWSATQEQGPVYEVRLTFSGGKESDGSSRKPLRFSFTADLERGTVEPSGTAPDPMSSGTGAASSRTQASAAPLRSNTLHAFFDESRIPPEERRAIAKDTEELVLAAQPGASPLALDTVVRNFARTYGLSAVSRIAEAYELDLVKKRVAHDTRLGEEVEPATKGSVAEGSDPLLVKGQTPPPQPAQKAGKGSDPTATTTRGQTPSRPVEFRMDTGSGRERTFIARAASGASPGRLWEAVTGYDRLKQFVPDMLVSEREGQDGAAIIVHTVCLTRFMFFVFKMNLHLRIIEHPQQHTLEFERIAGEFESFRGAIEVTSDPSTRESALVFRATVVPKRRAFNWVLQGMARRLLVSQLNAIRNKAETN